MKFKQITAFILFSFLLGMELPAAPLTPVLLTCEYRNNPLGIDTKVPRLGWQFKGTGRNQSQQAYELLVSDNIKDIKAQQGNVWKSGRVNSSQTIHIEYAGAALQSLTRYYWRVKIYDQDGQSVGWSEIHWFETAMLEPADWTASWIGDGSPLLARPEAHFEPDPMPLFRNKFNISKKISAARLYISGVGYYEAFLNGNKIGDHVLDPGWTAYGKEVQYVVYDISDRLKRGENIAGIMLGNGWWHPSSFKLFGRFDLRDYQETGRPCVKAEIHLSYTDGTKQKILTDENWQTTGGPIIRNNVYLGEHYDARLEVKDWMSSKTAGSWKNAVKTTGPSGRLQVQRQPPIRVTRIVKPVSIKEVGKDTFIVDMGQNFAGVARIRVKGPAGTNIGLRYGEGIFDNGSINLMTTAATQIKKGGIRGGPGAPATAWQEDRYILKGEGVETWSPRFTFHGFQYVEITGWPGKPSPDQVEGLRMNADLPVNGSFTSSNEMFNQLHEVIQWTFLSNVFSVQSDCPGREKMGYGADMVVSAEAFLYNYDMTHFYGKAVRDFANDQRPLGGMTEIAPSTGINERGYGDSTGPLGWQLAYPFLQKQLYDFYGDKRIIEQQYTSFQRQLAYLQSQAMNNLFFWDISDHEALDPKPESFSASVFYLHHLRLGASFAGILGKRADSLKYDGLAKNTERSILRQYHIPGTGRFDNATQSAQLFALWYGITPEINLTIKVLQSEIDRHKGHLSTGIFTTKMLFDVMREQDMNEIAYGIANQRNYPGWGHMLERGATTLWESWDFPETGPSRNHPMFGSVDEWFYRSLLGINSAGPGFERIIIKPQTAGDLRYAKGSYRSVRGVIASGWEKTDSSFRLQVTIPPNTRAQIFLPATEKNRIKEGNTIVSTKKFEKGYAVIETGSGEYVYTVL